MDEEFFKGVKKDQYKMSTGTSVELPIEYHDWTWINAAFPAPVGNVEKILPSGKLKPLCYCRGLSWFR